MEADGGLSDTQYLCSTTKCRVCICCFLFDNLYTVYAMNDDMKLQRFLPTATRVGVYLPYVCIYLETPPIIVQHYIAFNT